ncbi:unnamed protein product [Linum trigynum]|uniref:Uncharacterized protein n=1 Tax=Linum trigynum TaxID=586398 RepID=A0AAV2F1V1_9ROSI
MAFSASVAGRGNSGGRRGRGQAQLSNPSPRSINGGNSIGLKRAAQELNVGLSRRVCSSNQEDRRAADNGPEGEPNFGNFNGQGSCDPILENPVPLQVQEPTHSYGLGNLFCDENPEFLFEDLDETNPFGYQGDMGFLNLEAHLLSLESAVSCSAIGPVENGKSKGKAIMIESSGSPIVYTRRNVGICIQEPEEGVVDSDPKNVQEIRVE